MWHRAAAPKGHEMIEFSQTRLLLLRSSCLLAGVLLACKNTPDDNAATANEACDLLHELCPSGRANAEVLACHELAHDGPEAECSAQLDACAAACGGGEDASSTGSPDPSMSSSTLGDDGSTGVPGTGSETGSETEAGSESGEEDTFPASCWTGPRECDPRSGEPCAAGETCDIGNSDGAPVLTCFPPPNTAQLGDACDLHGGPFCSAGLLCGPAAQCVPFCCSDDECSGPGESCEAVDEGLGTLGGCIDATTIPECTPPGGHCTQPSDCCSDDCHGNHCH